MGLSPEAISEVFGKIAALGYELGLRNIRGRPGLWVHAVDQNWTIRVNPHDHEIEHVPSVHVAVEWNGFPAGIVGPRGGIIAAGTLANEDALIVALDAAIERARQRTQ